MSKTKLYILGGVGALILVVGFAYLLFKGPSVGTKTNTLSAKLVIWGGEDSDAMEPFISDFHKLYPKVDITYTKKAVEDYETDLVNALAEGSGPDIFAIRNDWLPKYQNKLQEAPKDIFTTKTFKDTFVDVASDDFVFNDKVYAAPLSVDSLALYYNKNILGSAGIATPARSWDELRRDVKKITVRGSSSYIPRSGVALGTTANVNRAADIVYLMMLQNKTVPYTDDFTQPTFDQAVTDSSGNTTFPASDALTFYTSFADPTSDVYTWNTKSNYSVDAFVNDQLGYMYGYSSLIDTIKQKAPNLNYDIVPVPQPKLGQNLINFASYWGYAVSKQTKSSTAAWKFISFMTSKDSLKSYYARHPMPAARKDMISDQIDTNLGVFASQNLTAKSFYKKDSTAVDNIFTRMVDDVTIRGSTIEAAIASATQKIVSIRSAQDQ